MKEKIIKIIENSELYYMSSKIIDTEIFEMMINELVDEIVNILE